MAFDTPDLVVRIGDTAPRAIATITDGNGNPIDVSSATVRLALHGLTVAADLSFSGLVLNGPAGEVYYDWHAGDFSLVGYYSMIWHVTLTSGQVLSAPNSDGETTTQVLQVSAA